VGEGVGGKPPTPNWLTTFHATLVLVGGLKTGWEARLAVESGGNADADRGALISRFPNGKPFRPLNTEDKGRTIFLDPNLPREYLKNRISKIMKWINSQEFAYKSVFR